MIATLPRSATYVQRHVTTPCSRRGCTWPGRFGTSSGSRWCVRCHQRLHLVEMVQTFHLADVWWLTGKAYQESELMVCVRWIREASDEEVEGVCELFGLEK